MTFPWESAVLRPTFTWQILPLVNGVKSTWQSKVSSSKTSLTVGVRDTRDLVRFASEMEIVVGPNRSMNVESA
jgi:hypothetical protein